MDLFKALQSSPPRIIRGSRDTLYCWPGTLAVIVRKDRTFGPFSAMERWSRAEVSHAMTDYLRPATPEATRTAAPASKKAPVG